jgi:hypothetical protein
VKILNYITILLLFAVCAAPTAIAGTITKGDWISLQSWNSLDAAGIMYFRASDNQSMTNSFAFNSFCIQDDTYIWPGTPYQIGDISKTVGPYNDNPVDPAKPHKGEGQLVGAVDYLFFKYWSGNYNSVFTSGDIAHGMNKFQMQDNFQRLLWSLQGTSYPQSTYQYYAWTPWAQDLATYNASSSAFKNQDFGTKVLNIFQTGANGAKYDVQNQLIHVPEPSFILLIGIAAGALGLAWRKM